VTSMATMRMAATVLRTGSPLLARTTAGRIPVRG
jgi:hypothetical protein